MAEFRRWLQAASAHQQAFEDERALWQALAQVEPQVRGLVAPQPAATASTRKPPRSANAPRYLQFVVACVLLLSPSTLLISQYAWLLRSDYRAGHAIRSLQLEDGSHVVLDAGAAIAVDYDDQRREIHLLRGRAWFNVAHGDQRRFQVKAAQGLTRDIGTAFEVALAHGQVQTSVSQGVVDVSTSTSPHPLRVYAGQRVHYRRGGKVSAVSPQPLQDIAAWRHGDLLLDGLSPVEAIHQLERYYSGRVLLLGNLGNQPISASFRSDRAEDAIRAIANRSNASIDKLPGGWLLIRGH